MEDNLRLATKRRHVKNTLPLFCRGRARELTHSCLSYKFLQLMQFLRDSILLRWGRGSQTLSSVRVHLLPTWLNYLCVTDLYRRRYFVSGGSERPVESIRDRALLKH